MNRTAKLKKTQQQQQPLIKLTRTEIQMIGRSPYRSHVRRAPDTSFSGRARVREKRINKSDRNLSVVRDIIADQAKILAQCRPDDALLYSKLRRVIKADVTQEKRNVGFQPLVNRGDGARRFLPLIMPERRGYPKLSHSRSMAGHKGKDDVPDLRHYLKGNILHGRSTALRRYRSCESFAGKTIIRLPRCGRVASNVRFMSKRTFPSLLR